MSTHAQTHRRGELHVRGKVDSFVIVSQPSALGLPFALPAQEFTDEDFDAEHVFGATIGRFHERLADCHTVVADSNVAIFGAPSAFSHSQGQTPTVGGNTPQSA